MTGKILYPGIAYFILAKELPSAKAGSMVTIVDADGRECLYIQDVTEDGIKTGEGIELGIGYAQRYPEWFTPVSEAQRIKDAKENDIKYFMSKGRTRGRAEWLIEQDL